MNPRKPIIAGVVLIVAGAGAAWTLLYPSGRAALDTVESAALSAWHLVIGEAPENPRLVAYGNVDVRQVNLAFQVGGRLESILVEEGDRVEAGDVLASIEKGYLEDDLHLAESTVAAQRALVNKLENGSRPEEIAQARAEMERAEAAVGLARTTFERQRELAQHSAASGQKLDEAESALTEAEARLRLAKASLALVLAGPRKEDIAAARARLRADQAALSTANRRYADSDLTAPTTGTILTRVHEPGAVLQSNTTVLTLAPTKPVWVRTYVSEPDLGRIRPGMAADLHTDSRPDEAYLGRIGFISPVAEFTPKSVETADLRVNLVYRLRVIVENADEGLRQGMPVTVVFRTADGG